MNLKGKRILLKSPFNPVTGYGKDGILLSRTLMKDFEADLHLDPKYIGLPIDHDVLPLFGKQRPTHFDIALNHEYPGEMGFPERMPFHADYIVGWTMYEFNNFGDDNEMTIELKERLDTFDLILVYDEVSKLALSEYMNEPERLRVLQGGYDSEFWKPTDEEWSTREWDKTFRFCMNGTMNLRKHPWSVLYAFKELKDEYGDKFDAELHMKTTSLVFPPVLEDWCDGLKIHFANWSAQDLRKFYLKMNCLLAPSWGEGKNLPALEAQTMGVPVAVSAVGGHMQWASRDYCYLMEGPIEEHKPRMGSMRVATETVKETIWHIYNNRGEAKNKGDIASRLIPQQCDWQPVVARLQHVLDEVPARDRPINSM